MSNDFAQRRLPFRQRTDLVIVETSGGVCWTVKDPLTLRYFQLRSVESFVLSQLDGRSSADEILARFARQFAPQQLSLKQLTLFVQHLWQQGLLVLEQPGAAAALEVLSSLDQQRNYGGWLKNPLAIRFRGIDPDRWLTWTQPFVNWLFSAPAVLLGVLFCLATLSALSVEWQQLERDLRQLPATLPQNVGWLLLSIAGIKGAHELGHAYACKRQGGECREIGVLLLLGTPCLYCNVSDAWLLPSRWKRAAIGAAGIYVELLIAAIAGWVWMLTVPGTIHLLALQVMLIASLNTLLLNGNPLLRYDGYYVLSDLLDIPNLRERARQQVREALLNWGLGVEPTPLRPVTGTERVVLLSYGLLSRLYLAALTVLIFRMMYGWFEAWGLEVVVVVTGVILVARQLPDVVGRCWRTWMQAWRSQRWLHLVGGSVFITVLMLVGLFTPLPRSLNAPALTIADVEESIIVTTPGLWRHAVEADSSRESSVAPGTVLTTLSNPTMEREHIRLLGEHAQYEQRRDSLVRRLSREPQLAAQLSSTMTAISEVSQRIEQHTRLQRSLELQSSVSGEVLPGRFPGRSHDDLSQTHQIVWPPTNCESRWCASGTEFARVSSVGRDVRLYVEQSKLLDLKPGQSVRIWLPQYPHRVFAGAIASLATEPVEQTSPELVADGRIPLRLAGDNMEYAELIYEVRVDVAVEDVRLRLNSIGTARIALPPQSLCSQLGHVISQTFR